MAHQYEWKTLRASGECGFDVHGFADYDCGVLKGQTGKFFIDSYPSVDAAVAAHPDLMHDGRVRYGSKFTDPQVSLRHLPDEDTPASGGMYPDDYDDEDRY